MANEGPNRNLYLAAIVACLIGAHFGYSVGFIGGILVLPSYNTFRLDRLPPDSLASTTSGTVSIWLVGTLIGVPFGMPVCSQGGRRRCLSFCSMLYVLGAALQMVSINGSLRVFDTGRLLNGLGVGAGTLVSPVYISEISPRTERCMLLSDYQTAIQLAALAGFWAAFVAHSTLRLFYSAAADPSCRSVTSRHPPLTWHNNNTGKHQVSCGERPIIICGGRAFIVEGIA